jgi:hypothetical protein
MVKSTNKLILFTNLVFKGGATLHQMLPMHLHSFSSIVLQSSLIASFFTYLKFLPMKTFFLILSGLLIACPALTQRAIVLSDLPFSTTPRIDVMLETDDRYAEQIENEARKTGSNVVWNFSDAPTSGQIYRDTTEFIEASRTPYFDLFPTATLAEENDYDQYTYYLANQERVEILGAASPTAVSRNSGMVLFTLPLNFEQQLGNSFTSISTNLQTQQQDTMTGRVRVDYLGYGTVRLPQGTFSDVAQLRFRFAYNTPLGTIESETYEFISLTNRKLVARFYVDAEGEPSFDYVQDIPTGRQPSKQPVLMALSPNPTNGRFNLTYVQRETSPLTIEVVDLLGRTVLTQTQAGSMGLQQLQLDLDAPAGVYTVVVRSASGSTAQKLILN